MSRQHAWLLSLGTLAAPIFALCIFVFPGLAGSTTVKVAGFAAVLVTFASLRTVLNGQKVRFDRRRAAPSDREAANRRSRLPRLAGIVLFAIGLTIGVASSAIFMGRVPVQIIAVSVFLMSVGGEFIAIGNLIRNGHP